MTHATNDAPDNGATAFVRAADPFGRTAPLVERATFPVLGVPLEVRSNAHAAVALAESAFGAWRGLDPSLVEPGPGARLDVIVHPVDDEPPLPVALVLRRHGPVFVAGGGANLFVTLLDRRHALAFVTPGAIADPTWAECHVLAWGRFAVTLVDRVPIHAAAVVVGETAVLLTGPSGVGKSTLCYACVRAGMPVLAEEVVHVGLRGGLQLWGHTPYVTLNADVTRWFPELLVVPAALRPNGKLRRTVSITDRNHPPTLVHRGPIVTCRLERGPGETAELARIERPRDIEDVFVLDPGFDQTPEEFPRAADALLAGPLFRLRTGDDPAGAVALVRQAARAGARS